MFHSHLGDNGVATANADPTLVDTGNLPLQPAVIPLTNPGDTLPTNGPMPLATSDAQAIPTSPASPMQASPPAPLAVMDPNQYQAPQLMPPTTVAPKSSVPMWLLLGGGALLAYLLLGKKGKGGAAKSRGRTGRYRRSSRSGARRLRRLKPYFA